MLKVGLDMARLIVLLIAWCHPNHNLNIGTLNLKSIGM